MKSPLLLDCPFPITTERLVIRPIGAGDGKAINECVVESFEQFNQWLPWAIEVPTVEESELFARHAFSEFVTRTAFHLGIFYHDRLIGMCGFHTIKWNIPSAEIGYWCRTTEQRKGFIKEAVQALTHYGFVSLGFRRIAILCDAQNVPSYKIAESLGFTLESKGRGIVYLPQKPDELIESRCYVRFNAQGL